MLARSNNIDAVILQFLLVRAESSNRDQSRIRLLVIR